MASSAENGRHQRLSARDENTDNDPSRPSTSSTNGNSDVDFPQYADLTAGGSKKSIHGNVYQLGLLTLVASRALKFSIPFYLISEAEEFEKFDDVVIDYGEKMTILQVKHSAKTGQYKEHDFCKAVDGDASLAKYFDSWLRFRNSSLSKTFNGQSKTVRYVFFTNRSIENSEAFLETVHIEDDDFLFEGIRAQTLKFKKGNCRSTFVEAIRFFSQEVAKQSYDVKNIDVTTLGNEITKAAKKLYKELSFLNKNVNSKKYIDGRSQLPLKSIALIRLSLYDQRFHDVLVECIKQSLNDEDHLRNLMQSNMPRIKVIKGNETHVFSGVMQEEIDEFLDILLIKVGQPDVRALMKYVQKEIQLNVPIAPNEFYNALNQYMLTWFSDRLMCTLKSQNVIDFIKTQVGDLNRFYALGDTRAFETEYSDYPITLLDLEDERLYEFLSNGGDGLYVACVSGPGVEQRVYSTIQKVIQKMSVKSGDWIYMTIKSTHLNTLPDVLHGRSTQFVIINLKSWSNFERRRAEISVDQWNMIVHILNVAESQKKKLLMIIDDEVRQNFAELIQARTIEKSPLYFQVDELEDSQMRTLYPEDSEMTVFMCGKQYTIMDMIESNTSYFTVLARNLDFLCNAISNPGSEIKESGLPYNVYVTNNSSEGISYYDPQYVINNTQIKLAVIQGVETEYVVEYFDHRFNRDNEVRFIKDSTMAHIEAKYRLVEDLEDVSNLIETLIYVRREEEIVLPSDMSYIIFNFDKSKNMMTIACNPANIKLPPPTDYTFCNQDNSVHLYHRVLRNSQFLILSAPAGYGKSSFCLNVRWKWLRDKLNQMPIWVVYINLPRLKFETEDPPLKSAFTKSATDIEWTPWQISCLLRDMTMKDRVVLLLDSFDEVKDEAQVDRINKWLSKIPITVSVLITTRPHSVNEILLPENRNLDGHFRLEKYTRGQGRDYIEQYIKAIIGEMTREEGLEGVDACEFEQNIAHQVYDTLNEIVSKKQLDLLGIPLESYLFCETLKSRILQAFKLRRRLDFENFLGELDEFNSMKLYEIFIKEKLILFLTKHKGLSRDVLTRNSHNLYIFSQHTKIITLFAYNQVFCREYSDINRGLSMINYSTEMTDEIDDLGLVRVRKKNGDTYFIFIHETYQEYFAVIHIMQELISNSDFSIEMKNVIEENRYDLRYRLMFSFMAQLSVNGNALLPIFNSSDEKHAILFWEIICKDGDVLGFAAQSLLRDCLRELTDAQKMKLKDSVVKYEWSSCLVCCIGQTLTSATKPESVENRDLDSDVPPSVIISYKMSEQIDTKSKLSEDCIKSKLRIKDQVVQETRELLEQGLLLTLVKAFEEIIEENSMNSSYWDIDGGFFAMASLGNGLNKKIANYFISRIILDPSWRTGPALDAILPLLRTNLSGEAKCAALSIVSCLLVHHKFFFHHHQKGKIDNVIHHSAYSILTNLVESLNEQLRKASKKILFEYPAELKYPILILKTILWVAAKVPYAVIISYNGEDIKLIRESTIHVTLGPDVYLAKFFLKIQCEIFFRLKQAKNKLAFLDEMEESWSSFIDEELPQEIRKDLTLCLDANSLEEFFNSPGSSERILRFFQHQDRFNLVTDLIVAKFTEVVQSVKAVEKGSFWSINGGIETVGYTGKFFNKKLGVYLILRSQSWHNNHLEAVKALERIYCTLNECDQRDRYFENAVSAYNECIDHSQFLGENLIRIPISKRNDTSPMDIS